MYFPMFMNIKNKNIVVIGGGSVAKRKTDTLLSFGANVVVIAAEVKEKFDCVVINREYKPSDLDEAFIVIASTNNREVNKAIADYCHIKKIYVNVVDSLEDSSFIFGATIQKEEFTIAVGTNGKNPKKAKSIKKDILNYLDKSDKHED